MRIALAATALCLSIVGLSVAQDAGASVRRATNIPAQSLGSALSKLATERGLALAYHSELVGDLKSAGAIGNLTTDEAFTKILSGTGLTYRYLDDKTVTIVPVGSVTPQASTKAQVEGSGGTSSDAQEGKKGSSGPFRVAQVDQGQTSGPSSVEKSDQASEKKPVSLEEIVVTGSRIPHAGKEGPQEVQVYSREQIEQSGQNTVANFLNVLPSVSVAIGENGLQTPGGITTVSLRGLPVGTTLVLLNGRRVETSGSGGFLDIFDLNNIPLAAVERIEVLAEGSSAVYGSDAIAGVVNIVLKKSIAGLEATVDYGRADETDETHASLAMGEQWNRGSLSIIGSYETRTELTAIERSLTASNNYVASGGPNRNKAECSPGNIFSADGVTPLPGLGNAIVAAVPAGFSGTPSIQEFAGTAGTLNECSLSAYGSLIPSTHRTGILVQGNTAVTPATELFTEVMYSHVQEYEYQGYQGLYGDRGYQQFTASASNPYNPFGTTVAVSDLFTQLPRQGQLLDTKFTRVLAGARGSFLDGWRWEVTARQSEDTSNIDLPEQEFPTGDTNIQNALNSSDPATALNPFVAGSPGPLRLLQTFYADELIKTKGRGQAIEGFISGRMLPLPSGAVEIVMGTAYDRDLLFNDYVTGDGYGTLPNTQTTNTRRSYAVFGEARVPLWGKNTNSKSRERLAVTLAGRYDNYNDFGGKSTPQFGVEWRPWNTLLIRGTYSEAFKAPSLYSLYSAQITFQGAVTDPQNGQSDVVNVLAGGNPKLRPLTGHTHTLGLVYSSESIPGLQVSITHWSISENNTIQSVDPQFIVNNESLFPERVVRNSSGVITSVDDTSVNFGSIDVAGFDYQFNYRYQTPFGELAPSASASQTYHYREAIVAGSPPIDATSIAQDSGAWAPRWKGTVALGWKLGAYGAHVDGRYVGRYQDYDSTREIGNSWLVDVNFTYSIGHALTPHNRWLKGSRIELGAVNLFNSLPQFSNYASGHAGYDPAQADIRGRFVYARVGAKF
jgi:iron complex outermembrane receptor protein